MCCGDIGLTHVIVSSFTRFCRTPTLSYIAFELCWMGPVMSKASIHPCNKRIAKTCSMITSSDVAKCTVGKTHRQVNVHAYVYIYDPALDPPPSPPHLPLWNGLTQPTTIITNMQRCCPPLPEPLHICSDPPPPLGGHTMGGGGAEGAPRLGPGITIPWGVGGRGPPGLGSGSYITGCIIHQPLFCQGRPDMSTAYLGNATNLKHSWGATT